MPLPFIVLLASLLLFLSIILSHPLAVRDLRHVVRGPVSRNTSLRCRSKQPRHSIYERLDRLSVLEQ